MDSREGWGDNGLCSRLLRNARSDRANRSLRAAQADFQGSQAFAKCVQLGVFG
jgi:hypothetical protein